MSHMRIQAALDYNLDLNDAYRIIDECLDYVEVFEVGTPFMKANGGLEAVKAIRQRYPDITIYADTKIEKESSKINKFEGSAAEIVRQAKEAGADICTVMAYAGDETVKEVIAAGKKYGIETLIDYMDVEDVVAATKKYVEWGPDYVSVNRLYVNHPENDDGIYHPLIDLKEITPYLKDVKSSIQGGVTLENIEAITEFQPSLICIGRGIYAQEHPGEAAKKFKEILDRNQK